MACGGKEPSVAVTSLLYRPLVFSIVDAGRRDLQPCTRQAVATPSAARDSSFTMNGFKASRLLRIESGKITGRTDGELMAEMHAGDLIARFWGFRLTVQFHLSLPLLSSYSCYRPRHGLSYWLMESNVPFGAQVRASALRSHHRPLRRPHFRSRHPYVAKLCVELTYDRE